MDVNNKLGQSRGACWFFAPRGQARRWRCEKNQCFSSALLSVGGWFDPCWIFACLWIYLSTLLLPSPTPSNWSHSASSALLQVKKEENWAAIVLIGSLASPLELRCTMFRSGAIYFGLKAVLMHLYCNCHFSSYAPTCQSNLSCVWKSYDFVNIPHVSIVNFIRHI